MAAARLHRGGSQQRSFLLRQVVEVVDFRSLRSELKAEVRVAEDSWQSNYTERERAKFRPRLDDSYPDPDAINADAIVAMNGLDSMVLEPQGLPPL